MHDGNDAFEHDTLFYMTINMRKIMKMLCRRDGVLVVDPEGPRGSLVLLVVWKRHKKDDIWRGTEFMFVWIHDLITSAQDNFWLYVFEEFLQLTVLTLSTQ